MLCRVGYPAVGVCPRRCGIVIEAVCEDGFKGSDWRCLYRLLGSAAPVYDGKTSEHNSRKSQCREGVPQRRPP